MKKTGTYRGDQKPVRVGLYERKHNHTRQWVWSWWNGKTWGLMSYFDTEAIRMKGRASCVQELPWRGVEK